ncbi:MAG: flagellar type III secretion system protein FliR [Alphaproteobacteria bacterium]|nr:flagellar type III secretion system protein FliR [Alphaproteobacteria bacterium]
MLNQLLTIDGFAYLLVFSRVGSTIMLMPGIGEAYIPTRIRLLFAILVTAIMTPLLTALLPAIPPVFAGVLVLIAGEVLIGVYIGMIARILVAGLATAGTIIAFLTGFANALLFNPALQDQGSITAVLLTLMGTLLLLITDMHHIMLMGVFDSYTLFAPGVAPPIADFADLMARVVAGSFKIGVQIAAPFIVVALMFYISLGLLARLMPQLQVFFVGLPLQIMLGLTVLMMTLSSAMMWFLSYFTREFSRFLG